MAIGTWTVIFEDKMIIKQSGDASGPYEINDDSFWNQSKFSNIWAIQYGITPSSDEVEHRDNTPHATWESKGISFQQFIDKWDEAHLTRLQSDWDNNNVEGETAEEKIARIGERPTSYSS